MAFEGSIRWPCRCEDGTLLHRWLDASFEKAGRKWRIAFRDGSGDVRYSRLRGVPYVPFVKSAPSAPPRVDAADAPPRATTGPAEGAGGREAIGKEASRNQQVLWNRELCEGPEVVTAVTREHGLRLDSHNVATGAHRLAKFGLRDPTCWAPLLRSARARALKGYSPQGVANMVWALGKMGRADPVSRDIVAMASVRAKQILAEDDLLGSFKPQEVANLVQGAARLDALDVALGCEVATRAMVLQWKGFSPQEMATVLWALTKSGLASPYVVCSVMKKTERNLGMFAPGTLASVAWAAARSGAEGALELVVQVAQRAAMLGFRGFTSQDLANLAWALAAVAPEEGAPPCERGVAAALTAAAAAQAKSFTPVDAAGFVGAVAKMSFRDTRVLGPLTEGAAAAAAKTEEEAILPQCVANIVHGLARLGFHHGALPALAAHAHSNGASYTSQNMANVIWGCALLGVVAGDDKLLAVAKKLMAAETFATFAWAEEQQSQLCIAHRCLYGRDKRCPSEWEKALLAHHYAAVREGEDVSSLFHKEVARAYEASGFATESEVVLDRFFVVDIVVRDPQREGEKLVVECDGPTHFVSTPKHTRREEICPNGPTLLKRKLLEASGFTTLPVTLGAWRKLGNAALRTPQECEAEALEKRGVGGTEASCASAKTSRKKRKSDPEIVPASREASREKREDASEAESRPRKASRKKGMERAEALDTPREASCEKQQDASEARDGARKLARKKRKEESEVLDTWREAERTKGKSQPEVLDAPREESRKKRKDRPEAVDAPRVVSRKKRKDRPELLDTPREVSRKKRKDRPELLDTPREVSRKKR